MERKNRLKQSQELQSRDSEVLGLKGELEMQKNLLLKNQDQMT